MTRVQKVVRVDSFNAYESLLYPFSIQCIRLVPASCSSTSSSFFPTALVSRVQRLSREQRHRHENERRHEAVLIAMRRNARCPIVTTIFRPILFPSNIPTPIPRAECAMCERAVRWRAASSGSRASAITCSSIGPSRAPHFHGTRPARLSVR